MFGSGLTEWCEIVELVVPSIIEEVKEEEMVTNLGIVVNVRNLMRQRSHLFERLKATEKIGAHMALGVNCQNELSAKLEMAKATEAAARKAIVKGTCLLRKTELKNDVLQAEIRQLKLDAAALETSKTKTKEEGVQLKSELKQTMFGFTKEKKKLEVAYQQQVDDMFFYGYHYCMKKYGIIDDIPNIPSNEENETELVEGVGQGDNLRVRDESTTTGHEDQDTA
ncbi:hypothetical protein AAG906_039301 [Vitis piasezkii]